MDVIDLFSHNDIKYYLCQFLTDEDKCILNLICSKLNFGKFKINLPNYAASISSLSLLQYTQDMSYHWDKDICDYAVNDLNMFKWLIYNDASTSNDTYRKAVKQNRLDVIIWINEKRKNEYIDLMHKTIINDKLDPNKIKFNFLFNTNTMRAAARFGYIHILEWFKETGYSFKESSFLLSSRDSVSASAIKYNQMQTLIWLIGNDEPHVNLLQFATEFGNLEILKYLVNRGLELDLFDTESMIQYHRNNIFDWAIEQGYHFSNSCIEVSIRYGNIYTLEILLKRGFILDSGFFKEAFYTLHRNTNIKYYETYLESCKLLHEYKFEWKSEHLLHFIQINDINVIQWIYENNIIEFESDHYVLMACYSKITTIKWVLDNIDLDRVNLGEDINKSDKYVKYEYIIAILKCMSKVAHRNRVYEWLESNYNSSFLTDVLIKLLWVGGSIMKRHYNIPDCIDDMDF